MGHAPDGRQRWIDAAHLTRAFSFLGKPTTSGDSLPLILLGGRAVASWSHRFAGDRLRVTVSPFVPDDFALPPSAEHAFMETGRLLDAADVEVAGL